MNKKFFYQRGYGGIEAFLAACVVGAVIYFFIYPNMFNPVPPEADKVSSGYCHTFIDGPLITVPSSRKQYQLIKENVLMNGANYPDDGNFHHFGTFENFENPANGKKYIIRDPGKVGGRSYLFASDIDPSKPYDFPFGEYGVIFLFHATDAYEPVDTGLEVSTYGQTVSLLISDIYKEVDKPKLPDWVLECQDFPKNPAVEESIKASQNSTLVIPIGYELYYPNASGSAFKVEEQLNWFLPRRNVFLHHTWWTPHCKPAIYLYPEKETKVNVQVNIPQGEFLYTDPLYPKKGWDVMAQPNGELQYLGKELADSKGKNNYPDGVLPYLYYEGRIADSAIEKPTKGFVRKYEELETFYDEILPKLGLNEKEAKEFKDYWIKALPKASYYFIGIVSQDNLNEIEPLQITPRQESTIRVTLYFEARKEMSIVAPPTLKTPTRNGFTVVEWGGMVKQDKAHPFTCIQ